MPTDDLGIEERLRRKMARPARSKSIATRFTEAEAKLVTEAAGKRGMTVREWAREVMLQAAQGMQTDPVLLTEIVALRMMTASVLRSISLGQHLTPEAFAKVLADVRTGKHATAREILSQYSKLSEDAKK